jgi:sugar phosphate isomerase/epimerase
MTDFALSSYWLRSRITRVAEFFEAAQDVGFHRFEVSGLRNDTFYDEIRSGQLNLTSFHSPAPPVRGTTRVMGSAAMRRADIVLTSLDAERREQAIRIVRRCIDVAADFGAKAVVLHLGQTSARPEMAAVLERIFLEGKIASRKADMLRSRLTAERARQHDERMAALRRSLDALASNAAAKGIRLGLENRPICEVPSFEDMGEVLSWYPDDTVGYWHDTGHAELVAKLGVTPHPDWLRAYGARLIGVHLHDVAGVTVHKAPGAGSVDWAGLAPLIPDDVLRVVEVDGTVTRDELAVGVRHLAACGW